MVQGQSTLVWEVAAIFVDAIPNFARLGNRTAAESGQADLGKRFGESPSFCGAQARNADATVACKMIKNTALSRCIANSLYLPLN
jgi:hypothetical protein